MKQITLPNKLKNSDCEQIKQFEKMLNKYNAKIRQFNYAPPVCEYEREELLDSLLTDRYVFLSIRKDFTRGLVYAI